MKEIKNFSNATGLSAQKRELLEYLLEDEGIELSQTQKISPRKKTEELPLSFAQARLWFLDQLEPGSPFYNIPAAVRLSGQLNIAALEQSLNEILRRHEILRTTFATSNEKPVQVIAPVMTLTLPIVNLQEFPKPEQESKVWLLTTEEAQRPFDLTQGSLIRASLLRLSEEEYVLLITIHHIVSDGWSLGVFMQELAILYEAFSVAKPSPLPELPIQYSDFVHWQRQWLQGEVLDTQLAYWKQQLAGASFILELPTDRLRPPVQTFRGARQSLVLLKPLTEALKALSQQQGGTLFMTLLAAFKTLLYHYTEQDDILVGSPIANRNRAEIEGLIGFFVNTLVLRTNLGGNPSFSELLGRVREMTLEAYAHQDLPFEKLVEELQPERKMSHSPLFQVAFALQNAPMPALELAGLTLNLLGVDSRTAKFDLALDLSEESAGLRGWFEYNIDLFNDDTIARMQEHFQTLLEGIVANPEQRLSDLPLLTPAEEHQILVRWNDTKAESPKDACIHQFFETQVKLTPDAVAVVFEREQISYRELNRRANQLAHYLQKLGVKPEVRVGICVKRSLDLVIGLLGILKAGGAYVPLDPNYPQERLAFMLQDAQAPVLLTQSQLLVRMQGHSAQVLCLDTDWETISQESSGNPNTQVLPTNNSYVLYTSGSTGQPKAVVIEHRSAVAFLDWATKVYTAENFASVLAATSICFDLSIFELFAPLSCGGTVILVENVLALPNLSPTTGVTLINTIPSAIAELLRINGIAASVRTINLAGEPLPKKLVQQLYQKTSAKQVFNLYGPSEDTTYSTFALIKPEDNVVSIGRPIANTQAYILDRFFKPVPSGVPGELHLGGEGLARGYLNQPGLTAEKFINNPFSNKVGSRLYKTGDLVRYLPDGNIEYFGRLDHQVKIRGFRIELGEIEAILSQYPGVREIAVIAREDIPGEKRLVAYLVANQESTLSTSELRRFLKEKLPDYMVPSAFVTLEALPLTPNGKLNRNVLPVPNQANPLSEENFVAPRNPIEEVLAGIWAEVLRLERVGIHDNFFNLGGHSLLATQVISRVCQTFRLELPLRSIFESPTPAGLAESIETQMKAGLGLQVLPIERVSRNRQLSLSFAQQRLWFINQLEPGNPAYNVHSAIRLTGLLDVAALEQTINEIVRRHEALRTSFTTVDGQPVQIIAPARSQTLTIVDISELSSQKQEVEALQLATEEAQRPFDLSQGSLLRVSLLQLNEQSHIVLVTIHHIISDAWSMGIFVQEVVALYEALSSGKPSLLPKLSIQYADFAYWQRQWLLREVLDKQISYWKQKLGGTLPVLNLPVDRPRPPVQTFRGAQQSLVLSKPLTESLNALSRREEATLFMTLLAAFQVLLYRYTGQDDIVVGTDIANRNRSETEELIGLFVNQLVLRTDLAGNPTFQELLKRVREVTLGAYAHQDLPFEKLVEVLQPERNLSRNPLFQVMFILQNAPMPTLELPGLTLGTLEVNEETSAFDLSLSMMETETRQLHGLLRYNKDLFEPATITRILRYFETLLHSIVAEPDARLNSLEMLTETEKKRQALKNMERQESKLQKLMNIKPKAVSFSQEKLIKTNYLQPEQILPLVIESTVYDIDPINWANSNREFIEAQLLKHGGILFRNFHLASIAQFEQFIKAIYPEIIEYGERSSPRTKLSNGVYTSTDHPAEQHIVLHNEQSYTLNWPMKICFFCVQSAQQGGRTPIASSRKIYARLHPKIIEKFTQKQVMYIRNYGDGLGLSWQEVFQTTDKKVVEEYCHHAGIEFEWKENNRLRTNQVRPAVRRHPKTGEMVWFNHAVFFHVSSLEATTRESLLAGFNEKDLPFNTFYGDGSLIEASVLDEIREAYQQEMIAFSWQEKDVLMLDNMLVAHGREPFTGSRKVVVAMAEPFSDK